MTPSFNCSLSMMPPHLRQEYVDPFGVAFLYQGHCMADVSEQNSSTEQALEGLKAQRAREPSGVSGGMRNSSGE